ncbi:MAG: tetratricopeptide repeat protein [Rhodospirillaceae bacterium]|nr:tetratricopeptide repeat protein [Rhodospirillaceae bacterium]MBT5195847.1 tetratricopeptide repeat protein [Rhodospirillaceae bacterium]MBT5894983.1 tetratricopeptide repeat protein [Rhodospirillaceae bacterium]
MIFAAAATLCLSALPGCTAGSDNDKLAAMQAEAKAPLLASPLGHYLSARLARDELDSGRAANFYDVALAANPENQALLHQTMVLMLAEGRMEEAIRLAKRRVAKRSDAAMARLILAAEALRGNDLGSARDHMAQTKRKNYMSLLQPMLMAWIDAGDDKYENAIEALEQLGDRKVFAPFQHYHTAMVSDFAGHDGPAQAAFVATLKGNAPRATRVSLNYGGFLSRSGREKEALALFDGILARNPNNPVISRAHEKLQNGDPLWPPITTAAQGVAEAFLSAGFAISGSRGGETARIYSQLALYLRPDLDAARMLLAEVLENEERFEDAIATYEMVPEGSAYYWNARIRIASNMTNLDRIDETVVLLRKMASERPDDTSALLTVARVLRSQDRFEETIATYGKIFERILSHAKELKKQHWILLYERGVAYERAKQWPAAEADFLKALELRPEEPRVLNYLGYSWIDQGVHLDRARGMIEKAVSKRPNDGYVVDSLGWVFYRLGRYEEAVKHLERAVELRPQDPIINDHLGDAYWRAGRKLEARFQWSHAIDLGAEEKSIPEIMAKQANGLGPAKPLGHDRSGKSDSGG